MTTEYACYELVVAVGFAAAHRQPVEIAVWSRDKAIETVPIKTDTVIVDSVVMSALEHRVGICGIWRDSLQNVPVFNDLAAIVQPEDVDSSPVGVTGPLLTTMQNNVTAFCEDSQEVNSLTGVLSRHAGEVFDER